MNNSLTNQIKVGYHKYSIELVAGLEDRGSVCLDSKVIKLNASLSPRVLRDTLLHEVLHIILGDSALPACQDMDPEKLEEHLVLLLSPNLLQFLCDNPSVATWLIQDE